MVPKIQRYSWREIWDNRLLTELARHFKQPEQAVKKHDKLIDQWYDDDLMAKEVAKLIVIRESHPKK